VTAVLDTGAPVFALIALGLGATRLGLLATTVQKGLTEFAFTLVIPALLFRTIAAAEEPSIELGSILAAYFGAVAIVWVCATVLARLLLHQSLADAAVLAMTSAYDNVVMLGIPLALTTFGPAAATPMAVILAIHTPALAGCSRYQSKYKSKRI
jgi:predicted permease